MENLIEYRNSFESFFYSYLRGTLNEWELENLMTRLENIHRFKNDIPENDNKNIWFKFGDTDTGATTIKELIHDLTEGNTNRDYRREQMRECVHLNAGINGHELRIFYS